MAAAALAAALAVTAPAAASTSGEPRAHASARTVIGQFVFNQDRTIRPRRSVTTRVFCPFRNTIPFTWGFRPISPRQPGVVVDAILTAAVPALGGGRAGFDITLANPNAGATIQVRVSVTCVQGRSGVETAINRKSPLFGAAAPRPRARGSAQPRRLELDGDRAELTVSPGLRTRPAVFCPSRRNTAVVDVGFRSGRSELVGVEPASRDGRPGARLTLQNRTETEDSGEVFVVCLQGKRFGVGYREMQGNEARAATAMPPTAEVDASAARTPGIRIERTVIPGTLPPGELGGISARCGGVTNSPRTDAIALGPFFGIGTGPLAAEHFLHTRLAGVFNAGASRAAAADVRARSSAAIFTGGILGLLNAEDAPAEVEKLPGCVKPRGGVRFRKGLRKP